MKIIISNSLAATIDNINDILFYDRKISREDKKKAAEWLAGRVGLPRSYAGMAAPTEKDYQDGIRLFTGEKIKTRAATGHILGEESLRAILLLGIKTPTVKKAIRDSEKGIFSRLGYPDRRKGTYCCGPCSVAYWRQMQSGGLCDAGWNAKELKLGIQDLKRHRDDKGRWGRYPFYFTLLSLSELDIPSARTELRYAGKLLERLAKRKPSDDKTHRRRHELIRRALNLI